MSAATTEVGRLTRQVEALATVVDEGLSPRARGPISAADRRILRTEIETCIQRLDDLRNRLAG